MKNITILLLLSFSFLTMSVQASETTLQPSDQPTYNSGSDWWIEVTPTDPDYDLYKDVQVNCFCG